MANAAVLNSGFTIFLNSIVVVIDNDFTIFKKFNCCYPGQRLHHIIKFSIADVKDSGIIGY